MNYKKILVTGGSGMVGKSLKELIPQALYISSKDCDLTNPVEVELLIKTHKPDVIIHLAAKVGGIIDNINKPAEYFDDNILMNTLLLKSAYKYGVERFIGILSTCIYPDKLDTYPMSEEMLHLGPPTPTNFSYGYAKRSLAVQIDAYNKQYGTKYQYLTPCNLYGEHDKYGDNSHFVAALIKKIHNAKISGDDKITLFGTGSSLRQFMYSNDLATIIKICLDNDIYENFNVATEDNISINEIAKIALKACDAEHINIEYDLTKPDGQYRKDVSIDKLKQLIPNFSAIPLYNGILETYSKLNKSSLFTN
jgi:GDP-L-fucose synthase